MSKMDDLEKLAALQKKGIITAEEFKEQKQQLLAASVGQTTRLVRTKRNMPETVFMSVMWAWVLVFILTGIFGGMETFGVLRAIFFFVMGFLFLPAVVLWIVALILRPFVIRARYFAYFLLLVFGLAFVGLVIDYASLPMEEVEYEIYVE